MIFLCFSTDANHSLINNQELVTLAAECEKFVNKTKSSNCKVIESVDMTGLVVDNKSLFIDVFKRKLKRFLDEPLYRLEKKYSGKTIIYSGHAASDGSWYFY